MDKDIVKEKLENIEKSIAVIKEEIEKEDKEEGE